MTYEEKALERILALVKKDDVTGCWLWQGAVCGENDYPSMHYRQSTARAHRVMYELTYGDIPKGLIICHKCDVPLCVNPAHLFLGTQKHNIRDCVNKGRHKPSMVAGEDHGNAVFTTEQVVSFRKEFQAGRTRQSIIDETGYNKSTIQRMLNGSTYTKLPLFPRSDSLMNHRTRI